jgi:7-cyano-7-deazaguanine synthase
MSQKAVVIVSGGMDSVTLAYYVKSLGFDLHLISFNYGQRQVKELSFVPFHAKKLDAKWDLVSLATLKPLIASSALTNSSIDVPLGHYAADNMKITVVPNRNAIMLSIGWGIAITDGASMVATGVHWGDAAVYPDCRVEFVESLTKTLRIATEGFCDPALEIAAPFVTKTKADIAKIGSDLNVDFAQTWSCYQGGMVHCSKCGTCTERRESMMLAGIQDPTEYGISEDEFIRFLGYDPRTK